MTPSAPPTDAGSLGLLAATTTGAVVLVVLLVATPLVRAAAQVRAAEAAADLAALAVLSGSPLAGGDGTPATDVAAEVARRNGARLTSIDVASWPVAVHVEVAVRLAVPGPDRTHVATAAASLRAPPAPPATRPATPSGGRPSPGS